MDYLEFIFSLDDKSEAELPIDSASFAAASNKVIEQAITEWSPGKVFVDSEHNTSTETFSKTIGKDFWTARHSKHTDISYNTFKKFVLENHTEYEQKYVELLDSYQLFDIQGHKDWYGAVVLYRFPKLFSDRQMAVYVLAYETKPDEEFVVVSIPADRELDPQYIRAKYCSIERIQKVDGAIFWTVITASDSRGNIPRWLQNRSMTAMIANDVPNFVRFVRGGL